MGYLYGVKGYRLLDPSTDMIIIEHNFQFEEIPLHAPLKPHANTYVPMFAPDINHDDSTHSNHVSYLSSESDSEDDAHTDDDHADVEPPQMSKWE